MSTPYFQVEVVERSSRELVLRLTVISGNPDAFYIERNFALKLALDAKSESALTRGVARQLGSSDLYDDYNAVEKALGTIAIQYVEKVEIIATDKLHPSAETLETGTIRWERDDDQLGSSATYRIFFTQGKWIDHVKAGKSWDSIAYDLSNWEESERGYLVEVIKRQGKKIVLRAKPLRQDEDAAPASARFALGVLVERAKATPSFFDDSVPDLDVFDDDAMIAAAKEHVASITGPKADGDTVTLEVTVADPAIIEKFEPGMRWAAFGNH